MKYYNKNIIIRINERNSIKWKKRVESRTKNSFVKPFSVSLKNRASKKPIFLYEGSKSSSHKKWRNPNRNRIDLSTALIEPKCTVFWVVYRVWNSSDDNKHACVKLIKYRLSQRLEVNRTKSVLYAHGQGETKHKSFSTIIQIKH